MFDDLKQDNQSNPAQAPAQPANNPAPPPNQPQQPQAAPAPQAAPPPNQPQDNPAQAPAQPANQVVNDMFADTDPQPQQQPQAAPTDKPSAVQSGKMKPITSTPAAPPMMPTAPAPPANMTVRDAKKGGLMKKLFIVIVVLVLVAIVVAAVYYFIINKPDNGGILGGNSNVVEENTNQSPTDEELDDDSDGLSNAEESRLGTNPLNTDTDNDGLFDREEVRTYNTNPVLDDTDDDGLSDYDEVKIWDTDANNPDTDGDSYLDGQEVINGYDPLGPGKLDDNGEDVTLAYTVYTDSVFGYSIDRPDIWVELPSSGSEPALFAEMKFLPNAADASEFIGVKAMKLTYESNEAFINSLPANLSWQEYIFAGQSAWRTEDGLKVMMYIPAIGETGEGDVYTISYEGLQMSGGKYRGVFQHMLDSFSLNK